MSPKDIGSLTAQQLMCARTTADMHTHSTCCAHVTQLMGDDFTVNIAYITRNALYFENTKKKEGKFWGCRKYFVLLQKHYCCAKACLLC